MGISNSNGSLFLVSAPLNVEQTPACGAPAASGRCTSNSKEVRFCIRIGTCSRMSIARAVCSSMNGQREVVRFRRAARHNSSGRSSKAASSRGSSNLRNSAWFFSVKPIGNVPSLLRSVLSVAITSGDAFTQYRSNRDQRDGNTMGVRGQLASVLLPAVAQEGAESLGFDKARQRPNLIERDAGRNRRTRGGMDVRLLQAQAQRR